MRCIKLARKDSCCLIAQIEYCISNRTSLGLVRKRALPFRQAEVERKVSPHWLFYRTTWELSRVLPSQLLSSQYWLPSLVNPLRAGLLPPQGQIPSLIPLI